MKTILVALDTSPRSAEVLDRAAAIAKSSAAELHLLRVVGLPPELPPDSFRSSPAQVVEALRSAAAGQLEVLAASLDPTVARRRGRGRGAPWAVICEAAKELAADLVVVGSHGYDALDHLLGTTAAKVVNHAKCSVLVVRPARATAAG
jgi:nucleotide-binding universal stress UspA family protein